MDAVHVELPPLPDDGAVTVELTGVRWPEDSFEVLAFLNAPPGGDASTLGPDSPCFVGPFYLYGSGQPRPAHAESIDLHVRLRVRADVVRRCARPSGNVLTLVVRDANGRPLPTTDLHVGAASLAR